MAEALVKRKRIRAGHRASATRIISEVEKTPSAEVPDNAKLVLLKLTLNEKLETLRKLDDDIVDLTEDETALEEEIGLADSFKECIYAAVINIDRVTIAPPFVAAPREMEHSFSRYEIATPCVKLPKLTLRLFTGDITKWTTFWECYESAIHNNEELSDIDKFNYLNSLLERTAREAISSLALTSANYREAIKILKKRLGSKQQIISKHMDILLNVEPVTSSQNVKALRHLYDIVGSQIRTLKSLGVAFDTYDSLLSPVLLNKLLTELRLIVSREIPETDWNLDALLRVMEREVEARE